MKINKISKLKKHLDLVRIISSFLGILCVFSLWPTEIWAQNFNPPYPRIGQITFYPLGNGAYIWKDHDMAIIRYIYGGFARDIKAINPDVILLATNDDMVEEYGTYPDEWYMRYADGTKYQVWGEAYMMDITNDCPVVDGGYGPQKFNEFLASNLVAKTNWTYFDGTFFDYWARQLWYNAHKVDLNRDGVADGSTIVNRKWEQGNVSLIENYRDLSNKPIMAHEGGQTYLNGNGFEFWTQATTEARKHNINMALDLLEKGVSPQLNYANSEAEESGAVYRCDFTSAQIVGAFFGHDEGTAAHRWTFLHDDYMANLGYPTSSAQELVDDVWVRYFDHGVLISNISGQSKTITSSQLSGGPYWRFKGSQDAAFNDGSAFSSVTFEAFDGIMLFKQPTTLITPIVCDNVSYNATSIGQRKASYSGSWTQTTDGKHYYGMGYAWDQWGSFYAYSQPGNGENTATYNPRINVAGNYEIFEWHGWHGKTATVHQEATNVPYTIAIGQSVISSGTIDQTRNYGQWNSLGSFSLPVGSEVKVVLTNKANGLVLSDAIQFVYQGNSSQETTPPNSPENLQATSTGMHSISLSWSPPSQASDGDVASYYNVYRNGSFLGASNETSYVDEGLAENTSFTYSIYAVDDAGNTSSSAASGTFSTTVDEVPPVISTIVILSPTLVKVIYSEAVEAVSAQNTDNYAIDKGITISQAVLQDNLTTVHLTTSKHSVGNLYTIVINNVKDRSAVSNVIASASSETYVGIGESVTITNISRTGYITDYVYEGSNYYNDRDYTITSLPDLYKGHILMRTSNDDKYDTASAFLSFDVNQSVTVFVAYDGRISSPPTWLANGFTKTDYPISVSDMAMHLDMWQKDFPAGTVSLGGNAASGFSSDVDYSMYSILIKGASGDSDPPAPPVGLTIH